MGFQYRDMYTLFDALYKSCRITANPRGYANPPLYQQEEAMHYMPGVAEASLSLNS